MLPQPCRRCGTPGKSLCDRCKQATEAARPSRQQRGYSAEYDRNRTLVVRQVLADLLTARCWICGRGFAGCPLREITAEHKIPLRHGGTSELSNLAPAHAACNYGWRKRRENRTLSPP